MAKPINERTTAYLQVSFRDAAGELASPTAVQYRVDCKTTGQSVLGMTSLTPASQVEIVLTANDNAMRIPANASEIRCVTVVATYGTSADQVTAEFEYSITNLSFLS